MGRYRSVPARCLTGRWCCTLSYELVGREVTEARMRRTSLNNKVGTPTEPSPENRCTHGIPGLVFGSAFTRR